jgi:uncharacterized SAM-binding protein YcdF (DUF218 family)
MSTTYIVSKLFTYLVLPPGIFIVMFLLASLFAKKFKAIFFLFAVSFYLLSNSYVANWLLKPLEAPFNKPLHVNKNVDAIVVLGGGSVAGSANLPLANDAYKRAMWGLMIASSQNLPLYFSGAGTYKEYTEADAFMDSMNEIKTNLHVNNISLHVETKSLDTYQNAMFSKQMFLEQGIEKPTIYLVTSAYHMKRSIALYKHFGFNIIPAATGFKISNKPKTSWDYLPNIGAFSSSYTALHEYAGLLSLILRGII